MAINFSKGRRLNALEVILAMDDAVDQEGSDFDAYSETLDLTKLKLVPGKDPTIFVCNFEVDAKTKAELDDAMVKGISKDGDPLIGLSSYYLKVVKHTLKDIKNPANASDECKIEFKRHGDGSVADETLNTLSRIGAIKELGSYYTVLTKGRAKEAAKN